MIALDHTHNPEARSWVEGADDHAAFPVQNLPLGVFSTGGGAPRIGTAIGDKVLDLAVLADKGLLPRGVAEAAGAPTLNALFALPPAERLALRHALFALLTSDYHRVKLQPALHEAADCVLHLPFVIGDYTDFYVGIEHATNVGRLFRPDNPLLPNYKHVPIAYHGRASSVRVSGTPVQRPRGQILPAGAQAPVFGPSERLDYELELGLWIAGENPLGEPVPIAQSWDRIGGLCILNDWSARDVQAWEYQPLGPFLAKNFVTSVSPWVVTAEALAPFRQAQAARPEGDPAPLAYLSDAQDQAQGGLAVDLEVTLSSAAMRAKGLAPLRLSQGDAQAMYWTPAQMIAHHTVNGCNLRPGDLLGTGTLSGAARDSLGSLLEITQGGRAPLDLPGGEVRRFLEDGDEVTILAQARRAGWRSIGLGTCKGTVAAARP